ncbi:MAG: radical SAM protein [Oscillospiraceae bacterium]|nr:radical SAM protein [Oscillospiraceae bacterium]
MLNIMAKKNDMRAIEKNNAGIYTLMHLFLELTLRCNEHCLHCGSRCGDISAEEMTPEQYHEVLTQISKDFDTKQFTLCVTGGEPLLRKDFFEIMDDANKLGYLWGMTSNGILITPDVAKDLKRTGMKTISISIDGNEETHDAFRRTPGGWKKAMNGIENLISTGGFQHIQVTTVVTHKNIDQLDELYKIFSEMDIDSWRIINIDPIGRAKDYPDLLLTKEDYVRMFEYIRNKRIAGEPVSYGCSHYLGMDYEREVRDWYFHCMAGKEVASIMCNGNITACLDIERRPEFIMGNIFKDRFKDVWENKFQVFRKGVSCENCEKCGDYEFCKGGAYHTWNFDENKPNVCFRDVLF